MNRLTLAVAGARKTQSIVDDCSTGDPTRRRLTLTFTQTGQAELQERLRDACAPGTAPEVMGWFAFLLGHYIRPYLPLHLPGARLTGLNFDGDPGRYAIGIDRFLDHNGRAYRVHLSKLAYDVSSASFGAVVDRLSKIYDEIYIDEVQDLTGCDLHIVKQLMDCVELDVLMVGDVRQSVYDTNPQDPNLKQYRGVNMLKWFETHRSSGLLEVVHNRETWRANQAIADFSDTVFPDDLSFTTTQSRQSDVTGHDGVFVLQASAVGAYVAAFDPQPLRATLATAAESEREVLNFGKVKGRTFDRVLIYPTGAIVKFLCEGIPLAPKSACGLYVAVTRARHSVAFVVPNPSKTALPEWTE